MNPNTVTHAELLELWEEANVLLGSRFKIPRWNTQKLPPPKTSLKFPQWKFVDYTLSEPFTSELFTTHFYILVLESDSGLFSLTWEVSGGRRRAVEDVPLVPTKKIVRTMTILTDPTFDETSTFWVPV